MDAGFVIPKAAPSNGALLTISLDDNITGKDLLDQLEANKGSSDFDLRINEIKDVEAVQNTKLTARFSARRSELRGEGETIRECYGFVIVSSHDDLKTALDGGAFNPSLLDYTKLEAVLGDPSLGIHVFRTAESALVHYGHHHRLMKFSLVMLKVIIAKGYNVVTQSRSEERLMEPQPQYDHHYTKSTVNECKQLLYVFQYNSDADIIPDPGSILPVALFNYNLKLTPFSAPVVENVETGRYNLRPKKKYDSVKVAEIIKRKKQEAMIKAAVDELNRREARKTTKDVQSPLGASSSISPEESVTESPHPDANCSEIRTTHAQNNCANAQYRYAKMKPAWKDIIVDCGYNCDLPVSGNKGALAFQARVNVTSNQRMIKALKRCGRVYCHEKRSAAPNTLVQVCRKLPQDSPMAAAFHLVVGFLRYQLGYSKVQNEVFNFDENKKIEAKSSHIPRGRSNQLARRSKMTRDAEVQCATQPEITLLDGPCNVELEPSASVSCSVMIQCNLGKVLQRGNTASTVVQVPPAPSGSHEPLKRSAPPEDSPKKAHPHRPHWCKNSTPNIKTPTLTKRRRTSGSAIRNDSANPLPDELQHDIKKIRAFGSVDHVTDDRFVLELIIDSVVNRVAGNVKRNKPLALSESFLGRLEKAFFAYLDREENASRREEVLLDLANRAQLGEWSICLDKMGVKLSTANDTVNRSKVTGQLWAQALVDNTSVNKERVPTNERDRRKVSRFSGSMFENSITGCGRDQVNGRYSPDAAYNRNERLMNVFSRPNPLPTSNYLAASVPSSAPIANLGQSLISAARLHQQQQAHQQNLSLMHIRNVLYQRRSEDLASALRSFVNNRQRTSLDDISLYSTIMQLRRHY